MVDHPIRTRETKTGNGWGVTLFVFWAITSSLCLWLLFNVTLPNDPPEIHKYLFGTLIAFPLAVDLTGGWARYRLWKKPEEWTGTFLLISVIAPAVAMFLKPAVFQDMWNWFVMPMTNVYLNYLTTLGLFSMLTLALLPIGKLQTDDKNERASIDSRLWTNLYGPSFLWAVAYAINVAQHPQDFLLLLKNAFS